MAEEIKSTPRPPETDGVSGRTFAKVRGRFNRSLANRKTTRGKRAGRWRAVVWPHLHIDDGSMGGGGPIPHVGGTSWTEFYGTGRNDPNSITGQYFTDNRYGIFHYCAYVHDITDNDWVGEAARHHWAFMISEPDVPGDKEWKTFLHELGHNLEARPKPTHLNDEGHHQITSCIMHASSWDGTNYCSTCWNSFDIGGCLPNI